MEIQTEIQLKEILQFLESGKPDKARQLIDPLFDKNIDSPEIFFTNSCCVFWLDSIKRLNAIEDRYENNEAILLEWKSFQSFIAKAEQPYEPALLAVQHGFFSNAIKRLSSQLEEKDPYQRAEIFMKAGICHKKIGDFENARAFLSEANNIYPNIASVLAELADCYSLCGEDKFGKVLFREAFFLDAESIDLDFLDSELIRCLINKTAKKGYRGKILNYWIPIYGILDGVFNIKRELNPQEVIKLRKDIYAMENEYKNPSCNEKQLIPLLLNKYFWLIDHYVQTQESVVKINEILLKIKLLDSSVYENYIR